jgi:putative ABC transport system permease protein
VRSRSLAIRVSGADPARLATAVQEAIWSVDANQPVFELQPMLTLVAERVSPFRIIAGLMLSFAAVSLLLGGVGIYGVTAYTVGRRTNEIGIRMAIGAGRGTVMRMIVVEGMRRAILGLVIGFGLALLLTRAMRGLLVGVRANDPFTFGVVLGLLSITTFLAAWVPARRAARLDPVRALSHE